jgi:hypothetical protein
VDLHHDQRLGLLDALLKDDDFCRFALLSTRSPVFGFDVGETFMDAFKFLLTRFSTYFFIPLPVDELLQVQGFVVDILLQMLPLLVEAPD